MSERISSGRGRRCQPLTPTLSPLAGRERAPRDAWEGEGLAPSEPTWNVLSRRAPYNPAERPGLPSPTGRWRGASPTAMLPPILWTEE